jgi:hypothetical protein
VNLEKLKNEILGVLEELREYISLEYLRLLEPSGQLIYRNASFEEGCKLREVFGPNTQRLSSELEVLLNRLYSY